MKELIDLAMELAHEEILPRWPIMLAWNLALVAIAEAGWQRGHLAGYWRGAQEWSGTH